MISNLPRALYRAEQVRTLDRLVMEELGIEEFELMHRAGAAAFSRLQERWRRARRLLVFAGAGNNGGDGYVVAALAKALGLDVQIVHLSEPEKLTGSAALAWRMADDRDTPMCSFIEFKSRQWQDFDLVVDALFGTGLNRAAAGEYLAAIEWINASSLPVFAVDIPSGLHADTGAPLGAAVRADLTVTFIGMKQGLLTHLGPDCTGELVFDDLDAPAKIYASGESTAAAARRIDIHYAAGFLPRRRLSSHKGSNGPCRTHGWGPWHGRRHYHGCRSGAAKRRRAGQRGHQIRSSPGPGWRDDRKSWLPAPKKAKSTCPRFSTGPQTSSSARDSGSGNGRET